MEIDPAYANKVGDADTLRIIRALEVYEATGRPLSSFEVPESPSRDFAFFLAGLTLERDELYERIEIRVDGMFDRGLVCEVKSLLGMGYTFDDPGMKGIGYREFEAMLSGCMTLHDVRDLIKRNTRRFAKRQMTFFKSFPGVCWFSTAKKNEFKAALDKFLEDKLPSDLAPDNLYS